MTRAVRLLLVAAVAAEVAADPTCSAGTGCAAEDLELSLFATHHSLERTGAVGEQGVGMALVKASELIDEIACEDEAPMALKDLRRGLDLGAAFLVRSQTAHGDFHYEYDWQKGSESSDNNPVRQSGTLWGLTLLHAARNDSALLPQIRKSLRYFSKHSQVLPDGRRKVHYPGQVNKIGSVALLSLAHIELLRQPERLSGADEISSMRADLDGYLKLILSAENGHGQIHSRFKKDGTPYGDASPYFDGQCLLALVKAARYLRQDHLWDHIERMADAGWEHTAQPGLAKVQAEGPDAETKEMKGYYQWSSMAWYELLDADRARFQRFSPRMLQYAGWMLNRRAMRSTNNGNMGYAYEGLIPAYVVAVAEKEDELARKLACQMRLGMRMLNGMQVGHPRAYGLAAKAPLYARSRGGAQNGRTSSQLRIDTTQHQMHAVIMAARLLERQALI